MIVDVSESNHWFILGLPVKSGYESISGESMGAEIEEVAKLPPVAVVVTAMKFVHGTAQELYTGRSRKNTNSL